MLRCRSGSVSIGAHGGGTPRGASCRSPCRRPLHCAAVTPRSRRAVPCAAPTAGAGDKTVCSTGRGVGCCRNSGCASPGAITCRPSERLTGWGHASGTGALGGAVCCATRQQREEVAESQLGNVAGGDRGVEGDEAAAAVAAEAAAEVAGQAGLRAPLQSTGSGSNMGTGTKYALMSTLEEQASIDAIEELQSVEPRIEDRGEFVFLLVGGALLFGAGVWAVEGPDKGAEYFAGYLLEQSLSIDNLFVFILVFKYLQVPRDDQAKVLTYGILSAAVLRGIMIAAGAELLENFQAVLLLFAGVLLFSSWKLLAAGDGEEEEDLSNNWIVTTCRRFIQVSDRYDGENFFTMQDGQRMATPLLLALAVIEVSDVVFAVDSVPAVFGVTQDPFIVYSSNMWAILSLRALYGFVSTIMGELRYLNKAVALVLGFVGAKMIGQFGGLEISTQGSLAVVAGVLGGGVGLSLLLPEAAQGGGSGGKD